METDGAYLKKEREAKNISLRKVSHLTKISEFYLDCLENDDYDKQTLYWAVAGRHRLG